MVRTAIQEFWKPSWPKRSGRKRENASKGVQATEAAIKWASPQAESTPAPCVKIDRTRDEASNL
jgi:hypothetical protein